MPLKAGASEASNYKIQWASEVTWKKINWGISEIKL